MGLFDGYDVASSGMSAQRTRINVVTANIANSQTTRTLDGGPYMKKNVVFQEILLNQSKQNSNNVSNIRIFNNVDHNNQYSPMPSLSNQKVKDGLLVQQPYKVDGQNNVPLTGVGVRDVINARGEPVMKYEPSHPHANEEGYVAYPNINPVIEMADMLEATKSYEANVNAFATHKTLDTQTIDILKG